MKKKKSKKKNSKPELKSLHKIPTACHDSYLLFDDEDWHPIFEAAFCKRPKLATSFAHLMFVIHEHMERGGEDLKRASFSVLDIVRLAYTFSEEHHLSFELYLLYLKGVLKPTDEPLNRIPKILAEAKADLANR